MRSLFWSAAMGAAMLGAACNASPSDPGAETAKAVPAAPAPPPGSSGSNCALFDPGATLEALGAAGGKLAPAQIAGGGACKILDATGKELARVYTYAPLEKGAAETEASAGMKALVENARQDTAQSVRKGLPPMIEFSFNGAKMSLPVLVHGWPQGSVSGEMGVAGADMHLYAIFSAVDEAHATAFMQSQAVKIVAPH